ncbi:MAG TPA: phospholipid carrier-dependent glycosyltransferase [Chloroflexia bacterium]|nr:phospholipid carrier-dependent glycosyltransferase [Chloroflexia bacterium]
MSSIVAWCLLVFGYLLKRYPYDGLYGQDSYAYYYQARALLDEFTGKPPQAWALFSTDQLYHWPIGYHIHLILGQIITGGVDGGRAITIITAVGAAVVLYLLVGELFHTASRFVRVLAGLVAGMALPLVATFTRMGLSVMADVPALFWGLLAIFLCLRSWSQSVPGESDGGGAQTTGKRRVASALIGGLALGIAVLIRYASAFFIIPVVIYLAFRFFGSRSAMPAKTRLYVRLRYPVLFVSGFALGILPQILYLITHTHLLSNGELPAAYGDWINGWSPANLFASTVTNSDGTATFPQPMIAFYLLQPLYDSDQGFLSGYYIPALLSGIASTVQRRLWPVLATLVAWWLVPALFYSGTTYQAHRFALTYLPVLLIFTGIGAATVVEHCMQALRRISERSTALRLPIRPIISVFASAIVLLGLAAGVYKAQGSVRGWMQIHESFKVDEQLVLALTRQAAGAYPPDSPPKLVAFGMTEALFHYTQWPTIELFNSDDAVLSSFLRAPGAHILVLPVDAISAQWAGTPLAGRWSWLQQTYNLVPEGSAATYTVFKIEPKP